MKKTIIIKENKKLERKYKMKTIKKHVCKKKRIKSLLSRDEFN
jgi:hypothetical protein